MTKHKLADKLDQIRQDMESLTGPQDKEIAHGLADDLLIDTITALNTMTPQYNHLVDEIIRYYRAIYRWYS